MAHTSCFNGHDMWNGDGKPLIEVYRINYFKDFMKRNPYAIINNDSTYYAIYDCYMDGWEDQEIDCWYCDDCHCVAVFIENKRYDYAPIDEVDRNITVDDVDSWEDYFALRDEEFTEKFMDFCQNKSPLEALEKYKCSYSYKVSLDLKYIYAFDMHGKLSFGFKQVRELQFDNKAL